VIAGTALAILAHPDDIEFAVAGTLLLLRDLGWNIHFWNPADGCYGSMAYEKAEITHIRAIEAAKAAAQAGATYHPAIVEDLSILYRPELIAKITGVVREVKPQIIITHSLTDYMEDHQNAARLAVTGTFIRAAPNFVSDPPQPAWAGPTVVYHAMPHGLHGPMREKVQPELYVDVGSVLARKSALLACHRSQQAWLEATQSMGSIVEEADANALTIGRMSGRFTHAEGYRRHLHLGFAGALDDPLCDVLADKAWRDPAYLR